MYNYTYYIVYVKVYHCYGPQLSTDMIQIQNLAMDTKLCGIIVLDVNIYLQRKIMF